MFTVIFTYHWNGANDSDPHTCSTAVKHFATEAEVNDFLGSAQENAAEAIGTYDLQAYSIAVYNGTSLDRFGHFHWNDQSVFFDTETGFFL